MWIWKLIWCLFCSETVDSLPIVGSISYDSETYYMVGYDANGKATLNIIASLAPSLLGY